MDITNSENKFKKVRSGTVSNNYARCLFDSYYNFDIDKLYLFDFFYITLFEPTTNKLKELIKDENIKGYQSYMFFKLTPDDDSNYAQFNKIYYIKFNTSSEFALNLDGIEWDDDEEEDVFIKGV